MSTMTHTKPHANGGGPVNIARENATEFVPFGGKDKIKLSVAIVRDYIANPTKSGAMPDDRQCMKFLMLCKSQALNPFVGDAFLVGYDGKNGPEFSLITAHQVFLKRAELHDEYDGMESGAIVRDAEGAYHDREGDFLFEGDTLVGGWATVHFKTRRHPMKKRLPLGSRRKPNQFWERDTVGMIVKCAEADALRASFPTSMGGLYMESEMRESEIAMAPPAATLADKVRQQAKPAAIPQQHQAPPANFERHEEPAIVDVEPIQAASTAAQEAPKPSAALPEITVLQVEAAIVQANLVTRTVCGRFGAKRVADLNQEQRRQIIAELCPDEMPHVREPGDEDAE